MTFFFFLLAWASTTSVPCTFVSIVRTGLDDQPDPDGRGEVEDRVALVDQFGDRRRMVDALDRVVESGVGAEMANIVDASGREVVEDKHLVPALEAGIG